MCLYYSFGHLTVFAVACFACIWGSLPCIEHCFGCHICSCLLCWSLRIITLVPHFPNLVPHLSHIRSRLLSDKVRISTEVPSVWWHWLMAPGCRADFLFTRFPWNLPVGPCYFHWDPTNLWWHQFPSPSIGDEFKVKSHVKAKTPPRQSNLHVQLLYLVFRMITTYFNDLFLLQTKHLPHCL